MTNESFILTQAICTHYNIETSFIESLDDMGLITVEVVDQDLCVHTDQISDIERILRLHNELRLNLEGIDVVFNLLRKERELRDEVRALKMQLQLYESE